MYRKHRYCVVKYATLGEIYEKLHGGGWTLCTGMQWENVLFLHTGGGEYAVVIEQDGERWMVESYTMPWFERDDFLSAVYRDLRKWAAGTTEIRAPVPNTIEYGANHATCGHCA